MPPAIPLLNAPPSVADTLSPLIASAGWTPVPNLLLRHAGRLGLGPHELLYVLHVLSHRRSPTEWPWVAVGQVAQAAGVSEQQARRWKASLEATGLVHCEPRVLPGLGRRADRYDLGPLFAALERLAIEEATQHATSQLPDSAWLNPGVSTPPELSPARPLRNDRARPTKRDTPRPLTSDTPRPLRSERGVDTGTQTPAGDPTRKPRPTTTTTRTRVRAREA